MISRHRQQPFPSVFSPEEIELDPEKELWLPGKKKIFVPSAPKPAFDWGSGPSWDLETISLQNIQRDCFRNIMLGGWDARYCDCVPSRSEYLGIPRNAAPTEAEEHQRQQQIRTYNDIRRSEVPMFRSRPRYGVLYDRYERMIRD